MQTITFNYLYRDSSNYKNFGSIDFSNHDKIPIEKIEAAITSNLIDGEFFIAEDWGVLTLYFDEQSDDDHHWYEFLNIEAKESFDEHLPISKFLDRINTK